MYKEKINGCKNNPENSSTTKVREHIPSNISISTISSLRSIENKHDVYRGSDYMKSFCESLREHAMKIILERKEMKLLTKEQQESDKIMYLKDKKYRKVRDHCHYTGEYRGAVHSICNLKYKVPKKILQFFIMDQTMIIILS